jgi:PEP-CTERM motif
MKILISFSIVLLGFLPRPFAHSSTQVDYSAPLGHKTVYLNPTTPVGDGNTVMIGGFNFGFNVANNANNPAALLANWHEYDSTTITTLRVGTVNPIVQPGSFTATGFSDQPVFNNMRIYLWMFSTTDGSAPAPGFANVNAYALFTSTSDPDWFFPALNDPFPVRDIQTGNAGMVATHGNIDATHLYLGTFSPVPEPSTVALLSVGLPAALLMLRKRRKA